MPGAAQRGFRFKTCLKRNHLIGKCSPLPSSCLSSVQLHFNQLLLCLPKIVDKALEEPKYSQLYAQLCLRLAEDAPNFEEPTTESQATQKQNSVSRPIEQNRRGTPFQFTIAVCFLSVFLNIFCFTDLQTTSDLQASR